MKDEQQPVKEAVTIAEMAKLAGMSRSRLYQLVREGVFPEPSRNPDTGRPFYTRDQQKVVIDCRRRNRSMDGRPVLFYSQRATATAKAPRKKLTNQIQSKEEGSKRGRRSQRDPAIRELHHGLSQLGLTGLDDNKILDALKAAYPDGHQAIDPAERLMAVFRHLKRQDSNELSL